MTFADSTLVSLAGADNPVLDLIVFPGGGQGPSVFSAWPAAIPAGWRLTAVCLPGHGQRLGEPAPPDLYRAAEDVAAALAAEITGPAVLCGHSMGALLALEVAHRVPVRLLAAAGCTPPDRPPDYSDLDEAKIHELVRAQIVAGGVDDPEMVEELTAVAAGMLRDDLRMLDGYAAPTVQLDCGIVAYYGSDDDVPVRPWTAQTTGSALAMELPGGHDFCHATPAPLLADLARRVFGRVA